MDDHMFSKIYHKSKKYMILLVQLLTKFIGRSEKHKIKEIYHMIKNAKSDTEIFDYIQTNINKRDSLPYKSNTRGDRTSTIWKSYLDFVLQKYPNNQPFEIKNYLDIGCNNGTITARFGEKLNLDPTHIYGIDLESFTFGKITPVPGFIFQYYDGYNIPYATDYFDIVSCSMVLHHVPQMEKLLGEINRVTKINGYFLIKEHNSYSTYTKWLIYLEHALYDITEYNISYQDFIKNYYQKPISEHQMRSSLEKHGFVQISNTIAEPSPSDTNQFVNKNNPTQSYYALYKKINNILASKS